MLYYKGPELTDPKVLLVSFDDGEGISYDMIHDVWVTLERHDTESLYENNLDIIELQEGQQLWSEEEGFPSEFGKEIISKLPNYNIAIFDLPDQHYGFSVDVSLLLYRTTTEIDCAIFLYHMKEQYYLDSETSYQLFGEYKEKPEVEDFLGYDIEDDEEDEEQLELF